MPDGVIELGLCSERSEQQRADLKRAWQIKVQPEQKQ